MASGADNYSLKIIINRIQGTKITLRRLMALGMTKHDINITPDFSSMTGLSPALRHQRLQIIKLGLLSSNFQWFFICEYRVLSVGSPDLSALHLALFLSEIRSKMWSINHGVRMLRMMGRHLAECHKIIKNLKQHIAWKKFCLSSRSLNKSIKCYGAECKVAFSSAQLHFLKERTHIGLGGLFNKGTEKSATCIL